MFDTVYVSTQIPLGAPAAASALDDWHGRLGRSVFGLTATKHLRVAAQYARRPTDPLTVRRIVGWLWVAGFPVRVELEIQKWSTDACEIGLRPHSLRWPVRTGYYRMAALTALSGVVRGMSTPVPTPATTPESVPVLRLAG
jgi:hypothetical protein